MATITRKRAPARKKPRELITGALALAQLVSKLSNADLWMNFDREADVLYISLRRQQQATETVELEHEGILLHYRRSEVVGVTVLDASTR
jgi:uncharacterized protein YuzE